MAPESHKKSHGIAAWPEEERPRERLLNRGPQALTDAELIAILIRVGFQGTNAVELGRQLLERFGSLRAMAEAPVTALLDVKGLKGAKAAQLLAAMEIARRVAIGLMTAGRYLKVIYTRDPVGDGVFVVTAYDLKGKPLTAYRRRQRRRRK